MYHGAKGDSQLRREKRVKKQIATVWRCLCSAQHWDVTWGLCWLPTAFGAVSRTPLLCC